MAKVQKKQKKMQASGKASDIGVVPLHDKVLLKELKEESSKTKSGIYLPESAGKSDDMKRGEVVAVGPGHYDDGVLIPMGVSVGDVVLYAWGEKVTIDGVEYTLIGEGNISAIIK
jgi:chaperonin GroES